MCLRRGCEDEKVDLHFNFELQAVEDVKDRGKKKEEIRDAEERSW